MASGLGVHVPRLAILVVVGVLATATMTWGAAQQLTTTPTVATQTTAVPRTLIVPAVVGQAYVFAKGTLEDAGFAWQVGGRVHGYAANTVAAQSPAPGTRVRDTGAPTITLTLERTARYPERGTPENFSPYRGTQLIRANVAVAKPKQTAPAAPAPAATPAAPAPATAPAPAKGAEAAPKKPAAKPTAQKRPPAFAVAGAPKEPLKEMPLVDRARLLSTWLDSHREPTAANVNYFVYQHSWVVTGARFGWWHGADALRVLIRVDEKAQQVWGIGAKSEATARAALSFVEARSH